MCVCVCVSSRVRCRSSWTTCSRRCLARCTAAAPCHSPSSTCSTSWTSRPTSTESTTRTSGTPGRATGEGSYRVGVGITGYLTIPCDTQYMITLPYSDSAIINILLVNPITIRSQYMSKYMSNT